MSNSNKKAVIVIYGAGGCGVNIVNSFKRYEMSDVGFARFKTVSIDTSNSNVRDFSQKDQTYLFDTLDGSGKKRAANYDTIAERTKELAAKFPPGDMNVIIHSASGGSGSVIGPLLLSELLTQNASVVAIVIGSRDSRIELQNTINTIKTYQNLSVKHNLPISIIYFENDKENSRAVIDERVRTSVVLLATFFSNEHKEMDTADTTNFLNYHNVTSFSPALTAFEFFSKEIVIGRDRLPISILTLTNKETESSAPGVAIEYQAVGYLTDVTSTAIQTDLPLHAVLFHGGFDRVILDLERKIQEIDDLKLSSVTKAVQIDSSKDHQMPSGLIL